MKSLTTLLAAAALACGGAQGPTEARAIHPHDLYPMSEGAVWSYNIEDSTTPDEPPRLGVLRVEQMQGERATIRNNSDEVVTYERRPEGIFHVEGDVWLLKAPIAVGREWPSLGGRTARIASVDEAVATPSGDYSGCVRVEETGAEDGRVIQTVYCPNVGMTFQRASMTMQMSQTEASATVRLLGYLPGPPPE